MLKYTAMFKIIYGVIGSILMLGLFLLVVYLKFFIDMKGKDVMMHAIVGAQLFIMMLCKFLVFFAYFSWLHLTEFN